MRVTRELVIETPPEALWPILWDVPRMAACLPGCAEAEEVVPHSRYRARMTQKVGPIRLSVPLDVEILASEPPRHLALSARGRDPLVGAEIAMRVTIDCEPVGTGARLSIGAEGQVLGKLGGLGQGIIQRKAEEALDEFGRRLARAAAGERSRMIRPFDLRRPAALGEVGALLGEYGDAAALYAGGTELLLLMKEGFVRPRVLVDVKRVPGLGRVTADGRRRRDRGHRLPPDRGAVGGRARARSARGRRGAARGQCARPLGRHGWRQPRVRRSAQRPRHALPRLRCARRPLEPRGRARRCRSPTSCSAPTKPPGATTRS